MIAVPDKVAMRTAGRELGLKPKEFELAVQEGEVSTVPGRRQGPPCVTRAELERVKGLPGFPDELRERLRVVGAGEGAALLGISTGRFARLARGGLLSPVRFYVNRYGTLVWLYPVAELRDFAERRPELLRGRAPERLRALLASGADQRPRQWRSRRVGHLVRQATGPWERAAARAVVLDEESLAQAVPDQEERSLLRELRPRFLTLAREAAVTREIAARLSRVSDEDEALWHRLMLVAEVEEARAVSTVCVPDSGVPARAPVPSRSGTRGPVSGVQRPRRRRHGFHLPGWFGGAVTGRPGRGIGVSRPAF